MRVPREVGEQAVPRQQTLAGDAVFTGVGLHTGASVRCQVLPAPADHGIVFLCGGKRIPARVEAVVDSTRCSALAADGQQVIMVEHLLAALAGLGVDNALVEVQGPELPALDGSALPYAEGLLAAGIQEQTRLARRLRPRAPVWIVEGDRCVVALPDDGLTIAAAVDYGRPLAGPQIYSFAIGRAARPAAAVFAMAGATLGSRWDFTLPEPLEPGGECASATPLPFLEELAPARTFCFEDWIEAIRAAGLGGGGSVENTLVLGEDRTSTPLRFSNELARHKALDLLGDLALLGARLSATVVAVKAGHALHLAAARRIRESSDEY